MLIIEEYIHTGEPVGSRRISKHKNIDLSPATLRNIMLDLTEKQMLVQPHASAGRIPTDYGYRVYVNHKLQHNEPKNIDCHAPTRRHAQRIGSIFQSTARYLSDETRLLSLVTTPCPQDSILKKLDFVPISDNKVLVVLVTIAGIVIHKTIFLQEKIDPAVLQKISECVNREFGEKQLKEIKLKLGDLFAGKTDFKNYRISAIIRLCRKAFSLEENGELFVSGFENIFRVGGTDMDNEKTADFLKVVADHTMIIDFLKRSSKDNAVSVMIGTETNLEGLSNFSVISAPYGIGKRKLGNIGVIGPKHMYYDRIYSIIRSTAERLSNDLDDVTGTTR